MEGNTPEEISHNPSEQLKESSISRVINNLKRHARNLNRTASTTFVSLFADINFTVTEDGFNLEKEINELDAPLIEVGGPTDSSWHLTDIRNSRQKMYISNITPGNPVQKGVRKDGTPKIEYKGKVDFLADATKLPFRDASVGALFNSCLPRSKRAEFMQEAQRVLKDNSLLIASGFFEEDMETAKQAGFHLVENVRYKSRMTGKSRYDAVFRKIPLAA